MRTSYSGVFQIVLLGLGMSILSGCQESTETSTGVVPETVILGDEKPSIRPIPDIEIHTCGTYTPIASLKYECVVQVKFNSQYNYLEFSDSNTCTWLTPTEASYSILSGTPTMADNGCHLSFYLTDGVNKSNVIDLDMSILPGSKVASYDYNHYEKVSTSSAGDFNKDGIKDILVTIYPCDKQYFCGDKSGKVQVISGNGNSILFEKEGMSGDFFGYQSTGIGDINSDGYDDILIAKNDGTYSAVAYSGQDQSELYALSDADYNSHSLYQGRDIKYLGDIQKNGTELFAIASPYHIAFLKTSDGTLVHALGYSNNYVVDFAGDVNKDGFIDVVIGSIDKLDGQYFVRVVSGKDFSEIFSTQASYGGSTCSISSELGLKIGQAGDPDQDGYGDIFFTSPCSDDITVLSPHKMGEILFKLKGENAAFAGDFNGDSVGDLVTYYGHKSYLLGGLNVISGADQSVLLSTSVTEITGEGSSSNYIQEGVETWGRGFSIIYDMYGDGKNFIIPTESYFGDYDGFYFKWWIYKFPLKK